MNGKQREARGEARKAPRRVADFSPWPPVGFIKIEQLMAAVGLRSTQSVYNYVQQGLLPEPEPIGPNRIGWRVEVARQALDELPTKVRRNGTGETLTARRLRAASPAA